MPNFISYGFIETLCDFDEEKFPFVAVSGSHGVYLVNLNEPYMECLVVSKTACFGS